MDTLKTKRRLIKASVTRISTFITTINEDSTLEELEVRLSKLDTSWGEYISNMHAMIELPNSDDSVSKDVEKDIVDFESNYFICKASLMKAINSRKNKLTSDANESNSSAAIDSLCNQQVTFLEKFSSACIPGVVHEQLPKIQIKPFSGNVTEWKSFHDMFSSSVDRNHNLTSCQKFHYLKSFLKDEAFNLLKHIAITDENYTEAWSKLVSRYDKKGLIVNSFIKTFMSIAQINTPGSRQLRNLHDSADEVVRGLRALGTEAEHRDLWLVYILFNKLDPQSKHAWADECKDDYPKLETFLSFVEIRCQSFETCNFSIRPIIKPQPSTSGGFKSFHISKSSCPKCNADHNLFQCTQFISLNSTDRRTFVNQNRLCFNCLRPNHTSANCRSSGRCKHVGCNSKHHSLVHPETTNVYQSLQPTSSVRNPSHSARKQTPSLSHPCPEANSSTSSPNQYIVDSPNYNSVNSNVTQSTFSHATNQTITPTALVNVNDIFGNAHTLRVLLDSGSQVSFVSESCIQRLGISRKYAKVYVNGIMSSRAGTTRGLVELTLHSRCSPMSIDIHAYILNRVTSSLPNILCTHIDIQTLGSVHLADPSYAVPAPIDMLIGSDYYFDVIIGHPIPIIPNSIKAVESIFGWVIGGRTNEPSSTVQSMHIQLSEEFSLEKFWLMEECSNPNMLTNDEQQAEEHFSRTHRRDSAGRFTVELPFKNESNLEFGNTRSAAINRLKSMERRFDSNPNLRKEYIQFMREYLSLGHMTEISPNENPTEGTAYYLPHHAVFKASSTTTKLRVVFDASAVGSSGHSLNSTLLVGPAVQRDLFSVCIRFRRHRFVFSADVEKMFRQILVDEKHRKYQQIVWRESQQDVLKHFQLNTVTYGTSSAPFISNRCLQQLGYDQSVDKPHVSNAILNDFYVDDIMSGADTVDELMVLKQDLVDILQSAGFHLRKWCTNSEQLLSSIPQDQREINPVELVASASIKVLGLHWFPIDDIFSYRISLSSSSMVTKRIILSQASSIFDPLGLLAPSIVLVKILFQQLWLIDLKWDDQVPLSVAERWNQLRNDLHTFETVKIPRYIGQYSNCEFIGFCDASQEAYAAVLYVRSRHNESYQTQLLAAKTKVAPIKTVSVPRLELCAAVLLCRLFEKIKLALKCPELHITAFTDSRIVLAWLSSPPRRWKTYISNRTSEILSSIPRDSWKHVSSSDNAADCASRGVMPSTLVNFRIWWQGPKWLTNEFEEILSEPTSSEHRIINDEERTNYNKMYLLSNVSNIANQANHFLDHLTTRISTWRKLLRIVAFTTRFINNVRFPQNQCKSSALSAPEFISAKTICLKYAQNSEFQSDVFSLQSGKALLPRSKLASLVPFLDDNHIVRVGGRIANANISYTAKHPVILPKGSSITMLLIRDVHITNLHAGVAEMFAILRQSYWIFGCRNMLRKLVRECLTCFRNRQSTYYQLMGNLPPERIRYAPPFAVVGCDYAGPITLRSKRGRNPKFTKGYIALFVCFTTKALHIELVHDLTTESFIAALRRFIARRGKCREIHSDNGTNFRGARNVLSEMYKLVYSENHNKIIQDFLAKDEIAWKFIPPAAPHFGGLWESAVRSVKIHLKRVIGDTILTSDEMYTLLVQIEALLNCRPLFACSDLDLDVLTPAHFLIGRPYTSLPEPNLTESTSPITNWVSLQKLVQGFWKRWHNEYITSLQQRPKWRTIQPNITDGTMVIVKEPNLPPSKWMLGRISKCHPGSDGHTRVVTIRTKGGYFDRPITRVVPLPFPEDAEVLQRGRGCSGTSSADS